MFSRNSYIEDMKRRSRESYPLNMKSEVSVVIKKIKGLTLYKKIREDGNIHHKEDRQDRNRRKTTDH